MDKHGVKYVLTSYTGGGIRNALEKMNDEFFDGVTEVRLRADKPLIIKRRGAEQMLDFRPNTKDIAATVDIVLQYSMYAFEEEIRNGFITIPGGNRIGICGRAVVEDGRIKTIKNISALNIRIAHEIKGCADKIIADVLDPLPRHTLIISPPGRGKTTLLRDLARQASDSGFTVGIVDERSEIAACYMGVAQNDVGIRTDVLDGCPKAEGMILMLRVMSPQIIVVDEIGKRDDISAIEDILNAGVKLFCTVHGASVDEAAKKPGLGELIERGVFEKYIVLLAKGKPGELEGIY